MARFDIRLRGKMSIELDVDGLKPVGHDDDEPVVVALDIEHHAITREAPELPLAQLRPA